MPLKPEGKLYNFDGKDVQLYPISKLVSELKKAECPRDAQTIRKWEAKGLIPPATFYDGDKRLYSDAQIRTFVRIAKYCGIKQGQSLEKTSFKELMWSEFPKATELTDRVELYAETLEIPLSVADYIVTIEDEKDSLFKQNNNLKTEIKRLKAKIEETNAVHCENNSNIGKGASRTKGRNAGQLL